MRQHATVMVTGGAGFIGSALVRDLVCQRVKVVVIDKLTYAGNMSSLKAVSDLPQFVFEHADICDGHAMRAAFQRHQPDAVMHLAAESHVDRSIDGPAAFVSTNVLGTYEVLEAARTYRETLSGRRREDFLIVHVSTDEVFGDLGADSTDAFREETPYDPSSPYSATKAASDHMARAWSRTYGLPVIVTNCSNNYGPFQNPEKMIPLMILNAVEGRNLPVYGDGLQVRDWLYVTDHVRALQMVLANGRLGETYNIGGAARKRNIEIVRSICELLQRRFPAGTERVKRFASLITYVPDRPGHDRRYAVDHSKITRELGWRPETDIDQGLESTIDWYLQNDDWLRSVSGGRELRARIGLVVNKEKL